MKPSVTRVVVCFGAAFLSVAAALEMSNLRAVPGYLSPTKAAVELDFDEDGLCSMVALPTGEGAPSVAQVLAGQDSGGNTAIGDSLSTAGPAKGGFQLLQSYTTLAATEALANGVGGFPATPETSRMGEDLGSELVVIDDINGDGVSDIALGSSLADAFGIYRGGHLWLLFMNSDGTVRDGYPWAKGHESLDDLPDDDHNPATWQTASGYFGKSIAELRGQAAGPTLAVVMSAYARFFSITYDNTGKPTSSQMFGHSSHPCTDGSSFSTASTSALGDAMISLDLNGDNVADLLVSDWEADSSYGRLHWTIMNADGTCNTINEMSSRTEAALPVPWPTSVGPGGLAVLGDIDNNGYDDVIVGMWRFQSNTGGTTTFFMDAPDGSLGGMYTVASTWRNTRDYSDNWVGDVVATPTVSDFITLGTNPFYGYALAAPGDLDGNGIADVVVSTKGKGFMGVHFHSDGSAAGEVLGGLVDAIRLHRTDTGVSSGYRSPHAVQFIPPLVPSAAGERSGWIAMGVPGTFPSTVPGSFLLMPLRARGVMANLDAAGVYDVYVACQNGAGSPVSAVEMVTVALACVDDSDCSDAGSRCENSRCIQCTGDDECAGRQTCSDDGMCTTCSDGILNQDEVLVDCGGRSCPECPMELAVAEHPHKGDCGRGVHDLALLSQTGPELLDTELRFTVAVDNGPVGAVSPVSAYIDEDGSHSLALRKAPAAGEYDLTLSAFGRYGSGSTPLHVSVSCPGVASGGSPATVTAVLRLAGFDAAQFAPASDEVDALQSALLRGLGVQDETGLGASSLVDSRDVDGSAEVTVDVVVPDGLLDADVSVVVALDAARMANETPARKQLVYEHAARVISRSTGLCCTAEVYSYSCSDGVQSEGESGVDCGGACAAC